VTLPMFAEDVTLRRFCEFHTKHPHVWRQFERSALRLIARGHVRYSADGILHVIRFDADVRVERTGSWKIDNRFSAFYSRMFALAHAEHAEFFETRRINRDEKHTATVLLALLRSRTR
jgi:hypothetical protein